MCILVSTSAREFVGQLSRFACSVLFWNHLFSLHPYIRSSANFSWFLAGKFCRKSGGNFVGFSRTHIKTERSRMHCRDGLLEQLLRRFRGFWRVPKFLKTDVAPMCVASGRFPHKGNFSEKLGGNFCANSPPVRSPTNFSEGLLHKIALRWLLFFFVLTHNRKSPTQEPPPLPFWQLTRTMVWVSQTLLKRKLGPWSEFPFLYRFTVTVAFEFRLFKFSVVWVLVWVSSFYGDGGGSRTVKQRLKDFGEDHSPPLPRKCPWTIKKPRLQIKEILASKNKQIHKARKGSTEKKTVTYLSVALHVDKTLSPFLLLLGGGGQAFTVYTLRFLSGSETLRLIKR